MRLTKKNPAAVALGKLRAKTMTLADRRAGGLAAARRLAKLGRLDRLAIRRLYATGQWTQHQLAARYSVSQPTISKVLNQITLSDQPGVLD